MNLRAILRKLSPDDIKRAVRLGVLERRRESLQTRLDSVLKEMASLEGNGNGSAAPKKRGRRKGYKLSLATRRKMAEGQRRRHLAKGKTEAPKPERKTRKLSAAGRAAISAAAKARWERARQAKGTAAATS